ncbi:hypothetical protein BJ170DRAFT_681028 [Xylariales sp. AK1849]|nr:hypothetical protein BJ170DRAFT_681028 [Xylariales sp. AK1849]
MQRGIPLPTLAIIWAATILRMASVVVIAEPAMNPPNMSEDFYLFAEHPGPDHHCVMATLSWVPGDTTFLPFRATDMPKTSSLDDLVAADDDGQECTASDEIRTGGALVEGWFGNGHWKTLMMLASAITVVFAVSRRMQGSRSAESFQIWPSGTATCRQHAAKDVQEKQRVVNARDGDTNEYRLEPYVDTDYLRREEMRDEEDVVVP